MNQNAIVFTKEIQNQLPLSIDIVLDVSSNTKLHFSDNTYFLLEKINPDGTFMFTFFKEGDSVSYGNIVFSGMANEIKDVHLKQKFLTNPTKYLRVNIIYNGQKYNCSLNMLLKVKAV